MNLSPDIEFAEQKDIKIFQENKLRYVIDYVANNSPYYKKIFDENQINYKTIRTLEDLQHLPFTEKNDLQLYNNDFYCLDKRHISDFMTTSGTLGNPVIVALSRADIDRLAYNEMISFACAGVQSTDIVQIATTLDKRFMAGAAYYLGMLRLGAGVIRVGAGVPELQWDTILRIKPTVLVTVPSFVPKMLDYADEAKIDYENSSVKKIICIGDTLRAVNFAPNLLATTILSRWKNVKLFSTYASTEMQTAYCECEYGCGGHSHPDLIISEIIDKDGNVISDDGVSGELVITTLGVQAMPLIRYKTGDIAAKFSEKCKCGRTTMRIGPIVGRLNQMVKYKGTALYPPSVFDVLDNAYYIENYIVRAKTDIDGTDLLIVEIGLKQQFVNNEKLFLKILKNSFQAKIRVTPIIRILPSDIVYQLSFPQTSRKIVRFIDEREK